MEAVTFPVYLKDFEGKNFELSRKTAQKIEFHHGVRNPIDTVMAILKDPDFIYESNWASDHHLYYKAYSLKKFYIVAVVDLAEKRIDTAYISAKIKKGKLLWKNS